MTKAKTGRMLPVICALKSAEAAVSPVTAVVTPGTASRVRASTGPRSAARASSLVRSLPLPDIGTSTSSRCCAG